MFDILEINGMLNNIGNYQIIFVLLSILLLGMVIARYNSGEHLLFNPSTALTSR